MHAITVDVGLPINPLGLQAQMMGGIMDGIGQVLSYSLHLKDGYFLEGSWDEVMDVVGRAHARRRAAHPAPQAARTRGA